MDRLLQDQHVAILVMDGFEQIEMTHPRNALQAAGAAVDIVSPMPRQVRGWDRGDWGETFPVDVTLEEARAEAYDALILPGGRINPDKLRREEAVQEFIRAFFTQKKPVAAICHGAWSLIDAGEVEGRRMTSYHSIQEDLKNAGADWVNEPVVEDDLLITSRNPQDLGAFSSRLVDVLAERAPARGASE